jgi:hypothetical protein
MWLLPPELRFPIIAGEKDIFVRSIEERLSGRRILKSSQSNLAQRVLLKTWACRQVLSHAEWL